MKRLLRPVFALVLCAAVITVGVLAGRQTVSAAPLMPAPPVTFAATNCNKGFFGLKPWYAYMPDELGVPARGDTPADPCGVRCFNIFQQDPNNPNACGQTNSDIPGAILAVVDDLLRITGLVAVAFILKGSFDYVGSRGNSERTASAQSTIISALTGLAIAMVAVALISYIGNHVLN